MTKRPAGRALKGEHSLRVSFGAEGLPGLLDAGHLVILVLDGLLQHLV